VAQLAHVAAEEAAEYRPATQAEQLEAPAPLKSPAAQSRQLATNTLSLSAT